MGRWAGVPDPRDPLPWRRGGESWMRDCHLVGSMWHRMLASVLQEHCLQLLGHLLWEVHRATLTKRPSVLVA